MLRGAPLPGVDRRGERITNAVFFDANGDGRADLWVASLDTLARGAHPVPRHRLWLGDGKGHFHPAPAGTVPEIRATGSVLAPADFDGDGDIDLLVGDRVDPDLLADSGVAAGTRLLRNDGGVFHDVTAEVAPALLSLRTVNDAVWADVDGDGTPDCIVVGDWMPVTVLLDRGGRLRDATAAAGLDSLTGWWQSIAAADLDGDGDTDLVVGNMGLDYPYRPSASRPFSLYVGTFGQEGRRLAVPAFFEGDTLYPWYDAQPMVEHIPSLAARFPTNHDYAVASLPEILGADRLRAALHLNVATTASMVLENDGKGHFRARPLPRAAQVSPITGIVPADFDADGHLDLVVAGNLYELDSTVQPQDAGVGLFLSGDGKGGFTAVMPQRSGLLVPGPVSRLLALSRGSSLPPDLVVVGGGAPHETVVSGRNSLAVRLIRPVH
jgi:hypothetical protein